jgi:ATP-dependent Zn protease
VLNSRDVDPVQYDRISREVRSFLQEQYKYVLTTLEENRPFVESVADRLLWDPVVDQSEMIELATRFGLNAHPE